MLEKSSNSATIKASSQNCVLLPASKVLGVNLHSWTHSLQRLTRRCLARAPRLKGKPLEFHRVFGILKWVTSWSPPRRPSEKSPGNELLNLGQLARTCLEPHWPTEEGRVLLSGLPCLKSFLCSISNVLPLPFLSPFSPPAPSPTQEQKSGWKDWICQGEEPGVGQECWEAET